MLVSPVSKFGTLGFHCTETEHGRNTNPGLLGCITLAGSARDCIERIRGAFVFGTKPGGKRGFLTTGAAGGAGGSVVTVAGCLGVEQPTTNRKRSEASLWPILMKCFTVPAYSPVCPIGVNPI